MMARFTSSADPHLLSLSGNYDVVSARNSGQELIVGFIVLLSFYIRRISNGPIKIESSFEDEAYRE